jgi:hypothetical protein
MTNQLPIAVVALLQRLVREAEQNNQVLDAYGVAERIKRTFPDEALATGELVAAMLNAGLRAMELARPGLIIEIILPPGTPPEGNAIDVVSTKEWEAI